jgi:5-methylcytosine-specific restriction endonuclease McrA
MGQYAHIIPNSWGGSSVFQNLLFLCNDCHRKFDRNILKEDPTKANSAIKAMQAIKDNGKKIEEQ